MAKNKRGKRTEKTRRSCSRMNSELLPSIAELSTHEGDNEPSLPGLEALLLKRFKGARTLRGVRYQILLSIFHAFEMWPEDSSESALHLEGFEDFDQYRVLPSLTPDPANAELSLRPHLLGRRYVQAKTADRPWVWSQLKKPLQGFLEHQRTAASGDEGGNPDERYVLAVDFSLNGDIARLARLGTLSRTEQDALRASFRRLCREVGATNEEAEELLGKIEMVSLPEAQLILDLKRRLADCLQLQAGIDEYLLVYVAQFLDWAAERRVVTRNDLAKIRLRVAESHAKEQAFDAIGRGVIERMCWGNDAQQTDFFEGKSTRPGHILSGLDARRPLWEELISKAASTSGVVVVRSASGQGKSTLCLRYAKEYWPHEHTFVLRFARSEVEVEQVRNFLEFRARELQLDTFLLIDNAGRHTPLWPSVVQHCASLGIPVLLTMRHEDWYRYAQHDLFVFDLVEPQLELDEARQIWAQFSDAGRLHLCAPSAEEAYDRIGEPHLLIEFVYLLTQGQMLADRLRDQLRGFTIEREDPAKREILRRVAVADSLGAPVEVSILLRDIQLRDDAQDVLSSLRSEYLELNNGQLGGLHWVRSDHLVRLLHDGYPTMAQSALAVLEAVPTPNLIPFVANAVYREEIDSARFLEGLGLYASELATNGQLERIFAILDGLFEAGERSYLTENLAFDVAYSEFGPGGPLLLKGDWSPAIRTSLLANLDNPGIARLREISSMGEEGRRGKDLCADLLNGLANADSPEFVAALGSSTGNLGSWLSWLAFAEVSWSPWETQRDLYFAKASQIDYPIRELRQFCEGAGAFAPDEFALWLKENESNILRFAQLHTESISIRREATDGEDVVTARYFFDGKDDCPDNPVASESRNRASKLSVSRIDVLRSLFPFCTLYQAAGWRQDGSLPSDGSHKILSPDGGVYPQFTLARNIIWSRVVDTKYELDSFYTYQKAWYELRELCLQLAEVFVALVPRILEDGVELKRLRHLVSFLDGQPNGQLLDRLREASRHFPINVPQARSGMEDMLKPAKDWASSVSAFIGTFSQVDLFHIDPLSNADEVNIRELAVHNLKEMRQGLDGMHEAMRNFWKVIPDYFAGIALEQRECAVYDDMILVLETWLLKPPGFVTGSVVRRLRENDRRGKREIRGRVQRALSDLESRGTTFVWPVEIYRQHPLDFLPLAWNVVDPLNAAVEMREVLVALLPVFGEVDCLCLMPLWNGTPFQSNGYLVRTGRPDTLPDNSMRLIKNSKLILTKEPPAGTWAQLQLPERRSWEPLEWKDLAEGLFRLWRRSLQWEKGIQSELDPAVGWDRELAAWLRQNTMERWRASRDSVDRLLELHSQIQSSSISPDFQEDINILVGVFSDMRDLSGADTADFLLKSSRQPNPLTQRGDLEVIAAAVAAGWSKALVLESRPVLQFH